VGTVQGYEYAGEDALVTNAKMAELKKSGELAKMLAKYGVAGW
jgi:hypothetical protein